MPGQPCWIAFACLTDRGHTGAVKPKLTWREPAGNTSAPVLGARALVEALCPPAEPQLVPADDSATGSDLLHTFPVGLLCSASLETNKKPRLQLTGLPAWKTPTGFPPCLPLELLIPVSPGANK